MPAHKSPAFATRSGMFRSVKVRGLTSPRSISSHVQGAETGAPGRSEEHTSELQSLRHLVCRLLLEKKNQLSPTSATDPPKPAQFPQPLPLSLASAIM